MRWIALLLAAVLLVPSAASAQDARRRPRVRRDRYANTLAFGASAGVGSTLGLAGAFLEYRPFRYASVQAGVGAGGSFGPALGASLFIDPITTRGWSLGVGGSLSHNFSVLSGNLVPGRQALPAATDWAGVEVQTTFRTRHVMVRVGVGRTFLLDTRAFRLGSEDELQYANLPELPFASPIDAVRAAARNEGYSMWFVHLDIAPFWRL